MHVHVRANLTSNRLDGWGLGDSKVELTRTEKSKPLGLLCCDFNVEHSHILEPVPVGSIDYG